MTPRRHLAKIGWADTVECELAAAGSAQGYSDLTDSIVTETATRIFTDLADPQTINRLSDGAWKHALWAQLAAAGLPLAWVSADLGGADAEIADGFEVAGIGRLLFPHGEIVKSIGCRGHCDTRRLIGGAGAYAYRILLINRGKFGR